MSGGSRQQTIGYWYHPSIHMAVCQGPIDALLRIWGAEVQAWQGRLEANGTLAIDAPELWGGESAEGGIQGDLDVMFGAGDQAVNTAVAAQVGADASAHRGQLTALWKGGRFGAMNPYPKALAFHIERVLQGWLDDDPWYPATAPIPIGTISSAPETLYEDAFDGGGQIEAHVPGVNPGSGPYTLISGGIALAGGQAVGQIGTGGSAYIAASVPLTRPFEMVLTATPFANPVTEQAMLRLTDDAGTSYLGVAIRNNGSNFFASIQADAGVPNIHWPITNAEHTVRAVFQADDTVDMYVDGVLVVDGTPGAPLMGTATRVLLSVDAEPGGQYAADYARIRSLGAAVGFFAMNPAHIIYDALTHDTMQGEPVSLVNDASFTAAADTLYAEGFGLCTTYNPESESVEQFIQRICAAIAGSCTRSPTTGEWHLDLVRGSYDLESLPVLGDDDILDWEDEPWVIDDATNEVAVKWFDPLLKQERTTAPLQALGAIDAVGRVNAQMLEHRAIPTEDLAQRVAARELRSRATALTRFKLTATRKPYSWRVGTYFRLQAPKRGIADMVCLVGEIDRGTMRSGAISITALQDVFGMPATVYVQGQAPIEPPSTTPEPAEAYAAFEAPYVELAARLSAADLDALDPDAGYMLAVAATPGAGINYQLQTCLPPADFQVQGNFDWCPSALVVEAADREQLAFTLTGATLLERVVVGTAALWGTEIVRVDAIDAGAGTVTLARGCADTVPQTHVAGERVFFYSAWSAHDAVEYVTAETALAALQTRTGTQILPLNSAPQPSVTFDQRAYRPYPPAHLLVNGEAYPAAAESALTITWRHRDRLVQADQLIDQSLASIGPEAGTTYSAWAYDDDTEALLDSATGISGDSWSPAITNSVRLRVEVAAVRDAVESWQRHIHTFDYVASELLVTGDGEAVLTGDGELIEV